MNNRILTAALGANTLLSACAPESSNPIEAAITRANEVTTTSSRFDTLTAGGYHSCGIGRVQLYVYAGGAYCWGRGTDFRLGNGSTANSSAPVLVGDASGLASALWSAISAGRDHTCGLQTNPFVQTYGPAECWGLNTSGQLGNGTTAGSQYHTTTTGGVSFKSITAGGKHTCGIATTGAAYCWGDGTYGQLGNGLSGGTASRLEPTLVLGGFTDWIKIEAGDFHTCGITTTGHYMYCWGLNNSGQLGIGNTTNKTSPTKIVVNWGAFDITAGGNHTCARQGATGFGTPFCWGSGSYGQLGTGSTLPALLPTQALVPGGAPLTSISAGLNHTCGVTTGGSTYCWGRNTYSPGSGGSGQLGDGTATNRQLPTLVSGSQSYLKVSAGYYHTLALKDLTVGTMHSWGYGEFGQLGNGLSGLGYSSLFPVLVQ